jgi:hypothetical protein
MIEHLSLLLRYLHSRISMPRLLFHQQREQGILHAVFVYESVGAKLPRRAPINFAAVGRQDHNANPWHPALDFARRLKTVLDGHFEIHQDEIWTQRLSLPYRFEPIRGIPDNLHAVVSSQKRGQQTAKTVVVICEKYFYRRHEGLLPIIDVWELNSFDQYLLHRST